MNAVLDVLWPSESGRLLGVSASRVRQLVDRGQLEAVRGPRGTRMIVRQAAEAMADERAQRVSTAIVLRAHE
jgi:hypothetical protein